MGADQGCQRLKRGPRLAFLAGVAVIVVAAGFGVTRTVPARKSLPVVVGTASSSLCKAYVDWENKSGQADAGMARLCGVAGSPKMKGSGT
jgi:hypothetical protein